MPNSDAAALRKLTTFPALVDYLRDDLDWPIEVEDADEITFEYEPDELGLDPSYAVKIKNIRQIRPLVGGQPWGVFFIEFESKRLPVVVLRRILQQFVAKSRGNDPDRPVWALDDLLFISALGEATSRGLSFAHFRQGDGTLPELRTFSWDSRETHFYYLKNFNLAQLRWPDDNRQNPALWREQWRQAFPTPHRYVIKKSQELAREMAYHAAVVRALVGEVYRLELAAGPLHQLFKSFKEVLLHDLTPDTFADMVAQTVAYGLFSAATQSGDELDPDHLVELIPETNPFLKELLAQLTGDGGLDLQELGVDQLVDLLRRTDMSAIVHDFGRQTGAGREDPVVHFYELFLSEYDKDQKVQRGVFYTPKPVVSFIIRSVDKFLREEMGIENGLADTVTWKEMINKWPSLKLPDGVSPSDYFVKILDPATGTGTFLETVVDIIYETMEQSWKGQGCSHAEVEKNWNQYVSTHLLPRIFGFELMVAPYTVAYMKLGLKLKQTGYRFKTGDRLQIYLTNALETSTEERQLELLPRFFSLEARAANRVKLSNGITVIIGNPPYSIFAANLFEQAKNLVNRFRYINGVRIKERGALKAEVILQDDYVKFIALAQNYIERSTQGIVGLITNSNFYLNPTLRGMRWSILESFNKVYLLDLGGQSKSERINDKNVFDIDTGVAISLLGSASLSEDGIQIGYLYGDRDKKYNTLNKASIQNLASNQVSLFPDQYLFKIYSSEKNQKTYYSNPRINEIFTLSSTGIKTARDHLVLDFDRSVLRSRLELLLNPQIKDKTVADRLNIKDNSQWRFSEARHQFRQSYSEEHYSIVNYRPFDTRWIYFHPSLVFNTRPTINDHVYLKHNLCLMTMRRIRTQSYQHFFIANTITMGEILSSADNCFIFPLYSYDQHSYGFFADMKHINLNMKIINNFARSLSLRFISNGCGDLNSEFGPEDFLHYLYGLFFSPGYRENYQEYLKDDYPRVFLTSEINLFRQLCQLGADLVALHLLEDDYGAASWSQAGQPSPLQSPLTTFVERSTGTTVGSVSKSKAFERGKVYLDTSAKARSSYFEGVPEDVWNFQIGGYQVCHKWLYDRRGKKGEPGRTLTPEDIAHYQRVVVALNETIRLMDEIDAVIEAFGGWPLVGSVEEG